MSYRDVVIILTLAASIGRVAEMKGQTLDRGEITGIVRDESAAVLEGVDVTLRETRTGVERRVVTSSAGRFTAVLLPLGRYEVRVERAGFAPATSAVLDLAVGQALSVNLVMKVAGIAESIDVPGSAGRSPAAISTVLETRAITALPIDGRDYRDFALLAPTAQPITGTRGTFRVGGQPGDYLALHVDGADFTNNFFGEFFGSIEAQNFTLPLEAVQEFQVTVGGLGAELGRSTGGLVNVVTKSGTNQTRGSAAYFLRHHALTSDDAFGNPPTGLVRHQFGGSAGGAIARDRTFYFIAADLQRQETPITVKFARDVRGIAMPELGIPDLAALEGQFPRHEDVTTFLVKLDHAVGGSHRLSSRASYSKNRGTNQGGGSTILSRATENLETFENEGISSATSLTSAAGTRFVAETKVQFAREDRPRQPQGEGVQVLISDTGTFGQSSVLPSTQDMYRYQISENASYLAGKHLVKVGADYDGFNMRNNSFALSRNGVYTFPTLERFLQRSPSLYSQYFGLNGVTARDAALLESFWQHEFSFSIQDSYRPSGRFTVDLGLRYDAQLNPTPLAPTAGQQVPIGKPRRIGNTFEITSAAVPQDIPDDVNNWAPRGEVSYDVEGNGRTILKSAAGLYYGRTPMIYFPVGGSGVTSTTIFAPPAAFGVVFPNVLPDTIAPGSTLAQLVPRPSIQYVDPGFQNPRVLNVSAVVTRQLTADWNVELGYLFTDSRNLRIGGFRSTFWDRNLRPPTTFDEFGRGTGILAAGRPDSTITQANALGSFGHGRYQGLVIEARKTFARSWQFYASYVLSKSEGNGSTERDTEALLGPSDPMDLETDDGINELDVRHSFKSYLSMTLPYHVVLASTWVASSGLAFPVYSATDVNGDGVSNGGLNPDRPIIDGRPAPRFPFHQPAAFQWDLRVGKGFPFRGVGNYQLIVEVFNVLNTGNRFSDPRRNAIVGQPNFRELNRTLGPRIAQLGMRLDF